MSALQTVSTMSSKLILNEWTTDSFQHGRRVPTLSVDYRVFTLASMFLHYEWIADRCYYDFRALTL